LTGFVLPAAPSAAGVALRPVADSDRDFLQRLYRSVRWEELAPTGWADDAKNAFLDSQCSLQDRHFRTAYAGAEFYLVEQAARPIGRLYVHRPARNLHLLEISLLPERRGHGLGAALLGMLQDEVRAGRADRVSLDVLATNPARRLYARLGFVETNPDEAWPGPYRQMVWMP
jgi:GNAT superfamily N-acetyltransferase